MNQMGYEPEEYIGKPIIAIINPWNEFNTCHTHFPERVKDIKRGIYEAGGFPIEIPVLSLGEQLMKPTAMMFRNFLAMEVEEVLKAHPVDGCVVMGGCDKTTPGVLMGAISFNIPTVYMPAGTMLGGNYQGRVVASGTEVWKAWEKKQAGSIGDCEWRALEFGIARSPGTCMSMGTAATMMIMAESLGFALPGAAAIPAVDSSHVRMARNCGILAVDLVQKDYKPQDMLTKKSFENAIVVLNAIGGSTNGIIHLIAMAKRANIDLTLEDFDRISSNIPLILNVQPSGKYVMEDFYYAGGTKALYTELKSRLHDIKTVNLKSFYENIADSINYNDDVIYSLNKPLNELGAIAVLRGNLAVKGAIIKQTACEPRLLKHTGKALVYSDIETLKKEIDNDDLDVDENTVLILQNAGPVGAPGMPEWGQLPVPKKLLKKGITDIVRISDARMSGTSYGTCILHVSPESYIGGNLGLVKTGDIIHLDVKERIIEVMLSEEELTQRREVYVKGKRDYSSGYTHLYTNHVSQADQGCDFDFLARGDRAGQEPRIF
jgi:dihydroxy-acid dehydratase